MQLLHVNLVKDLSLVAEDSQNYIDKGLVEKVIQLLHDGKGMKRPWVLQNPMRRLVKATGIKQSTLRQYINGNDPVQDVVKSIHKAYVQKTVSKTQKVDDFDKGVVRRTIYDLHKKSQSVTMPKLQEALKKKDIDISISTVSRTVHLLGFRFYKNASSRRFVSEREDIVLMRMTYLRKIHKFRQQGRHIVYLDETWLNTNRVVKGDWLDVPSTSMSVFEPHCKGTHRKVPSDDDNDDSQKTIPYMFSEGNNENDVDFVSLIPSMMLMRFCAIPVVALNHPNPFKRTSIYPGFSVILVISGYIVNRCCTKPALARNVCFGASPFLTTGTSVNH
ncbi:unnamed protein product [Mytilus coruscus]|uniref:Uncharacterized protein n=1 Tax=Mytilus coruscus TaxID=42192 RepID=A0A6J8ES46_MYTCO|nr:unnamed protein product [Mytilus coruscus]